MAAFVPSRATPIAVSTTESTVELWAHRLGDGGGEDSGRLPPVARLVGAGHVDRLGVGARRIAGVGDPDGRHVHRRSTVDDVPDPSLPRVDVAVVQPGDQPLLGEEDALEDHRLPFQFGNPAHPVHQLGDQSLGDVVGVEMVADLVVHVDEGERHQRVVGDVTIALVVRRHRPGVPPVLEERRDDPGDEPAVALLDHGGGVALDGSAEGITHRRSVERASGLVEQVVRCRQSGSSRRSAVPAGPPS